MAYRILASKQSDLMNIDPYAKGGHAPYRQGEWEMHTKGIG